MTIREIKKYFFAYRNGVVADALRRSGMPHTMIFGVDLPAISALADQIGHDYELAEELWNDNDVRESRILAAYVFPPEDIDLKRAQQLCDSVRTQEEANILVFRLLRRFPYIHELYCSLDAEKQAFAHIALSRVLES